MVGTSAAIKRPIRFISGATLDVSALGAVWPKAERETVSITTPTVNATPQE
jgi:hypothetical protein